MMRKLFLSALLVLMSTIGIQAETFIKEVAVSCHISRRDDAKDDLIDKGYTVIDVDMNAGASGYYVYVGYKTTTRADEAITDLMVLVNSDHTSFSYDGKVYHRAPTVNDGTNGDLNRGIGDCPDLKLMYTRDGNTNDGQSLVTALYGIDNGSSSDTNDEYLIGLNRGHVIPSLNLNEGTHGHYVYLGQKKEHTHAYQETFTWASDNKSCTVSTLCACGDTHSGAATMTTVVKVPPTYNDTIGWNTYTATITLNGKTFTDSRDVHDAVIPLDEQKSVVKGMIDDMVAAETRADVTETGAALKAQIDAAATRAEVLTILDGAQAAIDAAVAALDEAKTLAIAAINTIIDGSEDTYTITVANQYITRIQAARTATEVQTLLEEAQLRISDILTWFTGVTFSFTGAGMPIETQHHLIGLKMTFSEDGEQVTMRTNDASVTYDINHVGALSYFRGTPSVTLSAHENPQHADEYYTSFYSGLEAYAVPGGVTAYTAVLNADNNSVTILPIEDGVIAQGTAVLLKATVSEFTMETIEPVSSMDDGNVLRGTDVLMARPAGTIYVLSSKKLSGDPQETMAFYKYTGSSIPANKAYIELPAGAPAPARIVWNQHVPTDIENSLNAVESAEKFIRDGQIYIRKGEHIYNGQGMLVK